MKKADLKLVKSKAPDSAPYGDEAVARGWIMQVDIQRLEQQREWRLSDGIGRGLALMAVMKSWGEVPAGTLPNDHEVLAAQLGVDFHTFDRYVQTIMCGWEVHDNGRMYHPVVTIEAERMLAKRLKDKDRRARSRLVTRDTHGTSGESRHKDKDKDQDKVQDNKEFPNGNSVSTDVDTRGPRRAPPCPFKAIAMLWNDMAVDAKLPTVDLDALESRKPNLRARHRFIEEQAKKDGEDPLELWRSFFVDGVAGSKFLSGRATDFRASFDWVIGPKNFVKIWEGNYS